MRELQGLELELVSGGDAGRVAGAQPLLASTLDILREVMVFRGEIDRAVSGLDFSEQYLHAAAQGS